MTIVSKNLIDDVFVQNSGDTMTGDLTLSDTTPEYRLSETDATAENGNWSIGAGLESFRLRAMTDTFAGGVIAININRTGTTIDSIYLAIPETDNVASADSHLTRKDYVDTATVGSVKALESATTTIDVSAATAPTTGQVLKATSSTTATWQDITGNLTIDNFVDVTDYTSGTTTVLTLSVDPGSENNIHVFFDGVVQHHTEYSVSGTTLTFTSVIPLATDNIEVVIGTTLSVGTPADATVTIVKLADEVQNIISQKNYIINPTFNINQRVFAGGALADGIYGYDRWKASGASNITLSGVIATINSGSLVQVVEDFGYLGEVKFEIGNIATPFEYPDVGSELSKCQRYYQISDTNLTIRFQGDGTSGNLYGVSAQFMTEMRASPTVLVTTGSQSRFPTLTGVDVSADAGTTGFKVSNTCNSTGSNAKYSIGFTADAEL